MSSDKAYVLDASAVIAVLFAEPKSEHIVECFENASISTVNLSEVIAKLADQGTPITMIDATIAEMNLHVIDFDAPQAKLAGLFRPVTRGAGLSFGDRACLALAHTLGATAITTERAWTGLDIGVQVELAR